MSRNHIIERYLQLQLAEYRRIFRSTDEGGPSRFVTVGSDDRPDNWTMCPEGTPGSDGSSSIMMRKIFDSFHLGGKSLDSSWRALPSTHGRTWRMFSGKAPRVYPSCLTRYKPPWTLSRRWSSDLRYLWDDWNHLLTPADGSLRISQLEDHNLRIRSSGRYLQSLTTISTSM